MYRRHRNFGKHDLLLTPRRSQWDLLVVAVPVCVQWGLCYSRDFLAFANKVKCLFFKTLVVIFAFSG